MKVIRGASVTFQAASHEDPLAPGVWKKVLATQGDFQAGQVQMLNWGRLPVGCSFQAHFHEDMQEIFVLIRGTVAMTVGTESIELVEGDAVIVEPEEVHQMTNRCQDDVHYLVFGISSGQGGQTVVVPS